MTRAKAATRVHTFRALCRKWGSTCTAAAHKLPREHEYYYDHNDEKGEPCDYARLYRHPSNGKEYIFDGAPTISPAAHRTLPKVLPTESDAETEDEPEPEEMAGGSRDSPVVVPPPPPVPTPRSRSATPESRGARGSGQGAASPERAAAARAARRSSTPGGSDSSEDEKDDDDYNDEEEGETSELGRGGTPRRSRAAALDLEDVEATVRDALNAGRTDEVIASLHELSVGAARDVTGKMMRAHKKEVAKLTEKLARLQAATERGARVDCRAHRARGFARRRHRSSEQRDRDAPRRGPDVVRHHHPHAAAAA